MWAGVGAEAQDTIGSVLMALCASSGFQEQALMSIPGLSSV